MDVSVSVAGQLIKELELPVTVTEPGELESVELSVSGTESGRVALKTIRELKLNLKDVDGDEIAPSPENIRFEVVPASKAQVTADGVLHAMETGSAVITAHVTIGGVSKDASVDIEILESGENLIKGPSSSFDGEISESDWAWQCGYEEPASTDGVSQWTVVSEIERGGNTENRASG